MSSEWGETLELLIEEFFDDDRQEFNKLSCEMKLFYCHRNLDIKQTLSQWIEKNVTQNTLKSATRSEEFREQGNRKFKIGNDEASLTLYSKSVIFAPYGSPELSLALGNRSAVLFRLEKYQDCIRDIDYAVQNFNSVSLYPKLMIRKIKSLSRLGKREEGLLTLSILREFIAQGDNSSHCTWTQLKECENELNESPGNKVSVTDDIQFPMTSQSRNDAFPCASDSLELKLSSEGSKYRRRVLARETIEPGEVIFVEKPFSFVLLSESTEEHCQFCCKLLIAPVACPKCVQSLYCSRECMTEAQNTYHRWECLGLSFLQNLGVGHLALRTFLRTAINADSSHCKQVNELVTHLDDIPESDILSYVLTSTLLMVYLEEYTDFTNSYEELSVEGVGFAILKHMIQIICNAFAIKKASDYSSLVTYASGLFPSAAMMNHSCEPNIITSFCDNILVVRARRLINQGEEVFNCYGPHFRKMDRETRKEILRSQFFFDCKCKHCVSDDDGDDRKLISCLCLNCGDPFDISGRRPEEKLKCSSCANTIECRIYAEFFVQTTKLRETGLRRMDEENYVEACQLFSQCERLQMTFLEPRNNDEILDNSMDLAECYFMLGEYGKSWAKFQSVVEIAKTCFDEFDVEFAKIISRSIDAFLFFVQKENVKNVDDEIDNLSSLSDKMVKIAEVNFGNWSKEYVSFVEKKKTLTRLRSPS